MRHGDGFVGHGSNSANQEALKVSSYKAQCSTATPPTLITMFDWRTDN